MPQIAQQDYKVIAPKEGRAFDADAAALGELKKSILNGIGFDCLIKNLTTINEGSIDRILGIYEDGSFATVSDTASAGLLDIELSHTVEQYQGLAAVQSAVDEEYGLMDAIPDFTTISGHLMVDDPFFAICVDGKYLTVTGSATIEALTIAETGPAESDYFINITWEDAQKLIGLPLI